jgi:hypothetical protein
MDADVDFSKLDAICGISRANTFDLNQEFARPEGLPSGRHLNQPTSKYLQRLEERVHAAASSIIDPQTGKLWPRQPLLPLEANFIYQHTT